MNKINSIEFLKDFGNNNSPARVNRLTGHMQINQNRWKKIKPEHRFFILLHEKAHVVLNTSDEKKVDELAFKWYIKAGYPLTEALKALTRVLHSDSKENAERKWLQFQRCNQLDKLKNKGLDYVGFQEIANNPNAIITGIVENFDGSVIVHYDHYEEFNINDLDSIKTYSNKQFRRKKKAIRLYTKMGRAKKMHARAKKKDAKANLVQSKANDTQATADVRQTYADQGIVYEQREAGIGKGIGGITKTIAGAFGGMFGKGGGQEEEEEQPNEAAQTFNQRSVSKQNLEPTKTTQNNKKLYIGIGVVAVVVIAIIVLKK